ncbi:CpaD family pilus assembly lipoprotein [Burkholderia sp. S-53]|uniref:CpaD family pilus assembly lipoprotein n=1 Tax=Burkholderia sp. S-53 TaxID=2906514 RepID=UPI0021D28428|nr:CpaD family pilus assembly lipoprotein [Burkholderia sp. S-53]UXU90662.1 CpaD family pilus assembly lipoprotein [Burkholderia sp. S-53]
MQVRTTVLALLPLALAGCMSAPPPLNLPDARSIGFDGVHAVQPDCAKLMQPSHLVDAGFGRPGVPFGCATYTNLAAMLARPQDLVAPVPYGGADAEVAAGAVRRYVEDRVKQPTSDKALTTTGSPGH